MKEKMKKLRKNNKGFSLVELIIVIAIMAILIGILAPQFIKYVNNSRVSTDVKNGQEIASAISAAVSDGTESTYQTSQTTVTALSDSNKPSAIGTLPAIKYTGTGTNTTWYATWDVEDGDVQVYCGGTAATNLVYPTDGYSSGRKN